MSRADFWWTWELSAGVWEPGVIRYLANALREDDVFLDIGAYVGPYTLLASRLVGPGGRVYAFEPDPVARGRLLRNVRVNSAANVEVVAEAVTDRDGREWLSPGGDEPLLGNSESVVSPHGGEMSVPTVTLDGFCAAHSIRPNVLKIDVEGAEARVLAGGRHMLAEAREVVIELHERQLVSQGTDPSEVMEELFRLGDRIAVLDSRGEAPEQQRVLAPGRVPRGNATLALDMRAGRGADEVAD